MDKQLNRSFADWQTTACFSIILSIATFVWTPSAYAENFADGYASLQSGRFDTAIKLFEQSLENPETPRDYALWFLAQAYLGTGETDAAFAALNRIASDRTSQLSFEASLRSARIRASRGEIYGGISLLLPWSDHPKHGARALFHAGELSLVNGDTNDAERIWSDLFSYHPASGFSHKAVLRVLSIHADPRAIDEYTLLSMARSAAAAGDYITAEDILDPMERRPIDRRLRDDVLLLHGEVLFKLSRYNESLGVYREARMATLGRAEEKNAELGIAMNRLHLGDTPNAGAIARLRRSNSEVLETIETIAAVRLSRGDHGGARSLLAMLDRPTLTGFLMAIEAAFPIRDTSAAAENSAEIPDATEAWRSALAISEQLEHSDDRGLALAILALRAGKNGADLWRSVLLESDDAYLLRRAGSEIARSIADTSVGAEERIAAPGGPRADAEAEARALFTFAVKLYAEDKLEKCIRQLRVVRYGYPGTSAAQDARERMKLILATPRGAGRNIRSTDHTSALSTAKMLMDAGALREAADILEERSRSAEYQTEERTIRIGALSKSSRWPEAVDEVERWLATCGARLEVDDLGETDREILYPMLYRSEIRAAADSYSVDPALLATLARVQSRFDPVHHDGYRLGITGVDIEALGFARQFPDAPAINPEDLLDPAKAFSFSAWWIRFIGTTFRDTTPARVASTLSAGPANRPRSNQTAMLEEIARLPFRSARKFVLKFLEAHIRYSALFALDPERPRVNNRAEAATITTSKPNVPATARSTPRPVPPRPRTQADTKTTRPKIR